MSEIRTYILYKFQLTEKTRIEWIQSNFKKLPTSNVETHIEI